MVTPEVMGLMYACPWDGTMEKPEMEARGTGSLGRKSPRLFLTGGDHASRQEIARRRPARRRRLGSRSRPHPARVLDRLLDRALPGLPGGIRLQAHGEQLLPLRPRPLKLQSWERSRAAARSQS